ncbi:MAG TPA: hypothetical protein VGD64_11520 [Acidisarcina sp.]
MKKVVDIEKTSAEKIFKQIDEVNHEQNEAIQKLAKEAGIDLSGELKRPGSTGKPSSKDFENACTLTCCYVETSTLRQPVRHAE